MLSQIFLCAFVLILIPMTAFSQTLPIETGVSQTLAKWRATNYSDVRYQLNLRLKKMSPTLKGAILVSVNLKTASDIVLDWRKIKGKEEFYKVANVALNGRAIEVKEASEHLIIEGGKQGANTIMLDFESPIATSGAAITRYVDKEDGAEYVYSLFVPSDASTAFPLFDQPDLKARFDLILNTPVTWKVISNGRIKSYSSINHEKFLPSEKEETIENIYKFEETQPISTYVFAFAAGEFTSFEEESADEKGFTTNKGGNFGTQTGTSIYVRKSQAEKFKQHAAETFRLNREAVKYLESYFDYKFPFPKYDLVLIPEFPFGGMEHAGATFLRESSVIFPSEPTANDYISRANLIFHEAAHQWFGDTVTMKWFDDLWLKEGFAEFMAYKTLEKVMPQYNAWKIFYERNKQAAYLTDSTKGTTPIYQEIPNLSAAKSAYGNIVYRKAPSFLKQAEFYLGEKQFQNAVRAFLKKHEFANAEWTDLVKEFETASKQDLKDWSKAWVTERGMPVFRTMEIPPYKTIWGKLRSSEGYFLTQKSSLENSAFWKEKTRVLIIYEDDSKQVQDLTISRIFDEVKLLDGKKIQIPDGKVVQSIGVKLSLKSLVGFKTKTSFVFPNYQDYGYGIFLLDERSRAYALENIQTEKDDFLRAMIWGSLWDSVREAELNPKDYVALVIKNLNVETDESTIQTLLGRVSTVMNYYLSEPPALGGGLSVNQQTSKSEVNSPTNTESSDLAAQLETLLIEKMQNALTLGQRITFYRAFLNTASTDKAKQILKDILSGKFQIKDLKLKTKDKFDIATKLIIISDKDATNLLAELEKNETSDEAKRYAYAAKAGIATTENKQKFFNDFTGNKEISESYIESAFAPFNSTKQANLTLPFLENALKELPNLKRNRKIFFVNGWLSAFIGGQKSEQALQIVYKFLTDNPSLDRDLRLKVLEVADGLERAVKIRKKFLG